LSKWKSILVILVCFLGLFILDPFEPTETKEQATPADQAKPSGLLAKYKSEAEVNKRKLQGFWENADSFIVISTAYNGKMKLTEYAPDGSEKIHGDFMLALKNENHYVGNFLDSGKELSLQLSQDERKITLIKDGKTAIYNFTEKTPSEFATAYNQ
jgi:hypothetical protein